jgi:hypothetical protein
MMTGHLADGMYVYEVRSRDRMVKVGKVAKRND